MEWEQIEALVPGLNEARQLEEDWRALSYVEDFAPHTLLGLPVRHISLRVLHELQIAGNPLVRGGSAARADFFNLLWRLNDNYCRSGSLRWWATFPTRVSIWLRIHRHRSMRQAHAEVLEFIAMHYLDAPPHVQEEANAGRVKNVRQSKGYTWLDSYVDFFAEHYGWTRAEVLDAPMPLIFRLYRANRVRHGVDMPSACPSDKMVKDFVASAVAAKSQQKAKGKD